MQMAVRPKPLEAMLAARPVSVRSHVAAVLDQAGFGIGLLPEEEEIRVLQFIEKLVVFGGQVEGSGGGAGSLCWAAVRLPRRPTSAESKQAGVRQRQAQRQARPFAPAVCGGRSCSGGRIRREHASACFSNPPNRFILKADLSNSFWLAMILDAWQPGVDEPRPDAGADGESGRSMRQNNG